MKWCEVSLVTDFESSDVLQSLLIDNGAGGVELYDPALLHALSGTLLEADEPLPDVILPCDRQVVVKAYFTDTPEMTAVISKLRVIIGDLVGQGLIRDTEVTIAPVNDDDWAHAWKQYFKPVQVGRRLLVIPSWLVDSPEVDTITDDMEDSLSIVLDPGMAFGTGTHPTTVLCMELLEEVIKVGDTFADIGTGSGILSIAASKLGGQGIAVDIDPLAVQTAGGNILLNGLEEYVTVNLCDITQPEQATSSGFSAGQFDVVVANIVAEVLVRLMPYMSPMLAPTGSLILSGIIENKLPLVLQSIDENGLTVDKVTESGEWRALIVKARP